MEKQEINLQEALSLITQYGLTVTSADGKVKAKPKKRVPNRRPKGSGSVVNLGKGRSKPYGAFVTTGYDDETGNQIQKSIGYFKTREEALSSLEMYNMQKKGFIKETEGLINPSNIEIPKSKCPTFKEIWDIIFEEDISKKAYSTTVNYKVGFNNLSDIHEYKIDRLTLHILQPVFDEVMKKGAGDSKLNMMKVVCKAIFRYAMKYDYVEKDYSEFISYKPTNEPIRNRKAFSNEEIKKIVKLGSIESKMVLIAILTGVRPQELVGIEKENVFLDKNYMIGGMKTDNGKDRIIPIHKFIKPFIEELVKRNNDKYLIFNYNGRKAYEEYRTNIFYNVMDGIGIKVDPYSTRHTFATLSKLDGVNEFARKKIMGHSSNDLTDDVYTHAPIDFLVNEINKIKV